MCRPKAQPALEGVTVAIIAVRCCIGIVSTGVVLCLFWFELIMSRTPRGVVCLYTIVLYVFHYFSAVSFYGVSRRLVLPPIHNFLCISSVGDR